MAPIQPDESSSSRSDYGSNANSCSDIVQIVGNRACHGGLDYGVAQIGWIWGIKYRYGTVRLSWGVLNKAQNHHGAGNPNFISSASSPTAETKPAKFCYHSLSFIWSVSHALRIGHLSQYNST